MLVQRRFSSRGGQLQLPWFVETAGFPFSDLFCSGLLLQTLMNAWKEASMRVCA